LKKRNTFDEFIYDASSPLPKRSAKQMAELLVHGDIPGYDRKLITHTLNEMYETARLLKDIRQKPKITVFGSARTAEDHPDYILCKQFSKQMADLGYMTITGAGPGIMAAGHEGAGHENSIGVSVELPFEEGANRFVKESDYLITCRYFFTRKLAFIRESDAVILFPGGFGTMDEAFEILTLLHTGRTMPVPLVLMEHEGSNYWEKWMKYVKEGLLDEGNISPDDMYLFRRFHTVEESADYISNFYRRYHSMRYVKDIQVIRLNTPVPNKLLEDLGVEYADFLGEFGIQKSEALPEEKNEPDIVHLPRLLIKGSKSQPVKLYNFIRSLNREVIASSTRRQDRENVCNLGPVKQANPRPKREKVTKLPSRK
jgi:uncharacterized protein (TIGR00730 family)